MNNSIKEISHIVRIALKKKGIISKNDTSVIFYNLASLQKRLKEIINVFPKNSLHTVAIKANPLISILRLAQKSGFGAEAASMPEIHLALKAGISPDKIFFDSPAKTKDEISFAMKAGININADSFDELDIIRNLISRLKSKSKIGLRINPQTGIGSIEDTSVSGEYSKFGIPIKEFRDELEDYYLNNEWLRSVHYHIGSQGININMLIKGAGIIYNFAEKTNSLLSQGSKSLISTIDIGGGIPAKYKAADKVFNVKDYSNLLRRRYPEWFSNNYRLVTEFGRYIYANSAWAASRVEYVKENKTKKTIVIHIGADMFVRKTYQPDIWHHNISVLDKDGNIKRNKKEYKYAVAGPLCFSGDAIAKEIILPETEKGDIIVVHDVGAYTLSMWSRYNSRQMPKVIGYKPDREKFYILKKREDIKKVLDFWS